MSRKRTLYLSELLLRNENDTLAVHIGKPYEMYFDNIPQCIKYIKDTPLWDCEVEKYLQAKWNNTKKWIPTLYIKLK